MANRLPASGRVLASERLLCSASALQKDLVSHWKLDEVSGTRYDAAGNNNLADNNTVQATVGKLGNAAQFTAANSEHLSVADNASLSMGDIDFTIAFWVYLDTLGVSNALVTKGNYGNSQCEFAIYRESNNKIYAKVANGTTFAEIDSTGIAASTWYFCVVWYDSVANTVNIQINNGAPRSISYSGGSYNSTKTFTLGGNDGGAGGAFLNGNLDSISVWKRVLTTVERAALYNNGNGLAFPF